MTKRLSSAIILLIGSCLTLQAQYTEVINSNRPGNSQGAFAVGNQVLQLEIGGLLGREEHRLQNTETNAFGVEYAIRFGLIWEQLEINLMGSYLSEKITDLKSVVPIETERSNFPSNTLGAKYLIYDPYKKRAMEKPNLHSWHANNSFQWRDLIPAVSVYGGINVNSTDNPFLPLDEPRITPKVLIATQNNFQGGWVFVINLIADRITSELPTYSYIASLTHAFNPKFSAFIENEGIMSDFYADQLFNFGAAYLFGKNFQLDAMATMNFKDTPSRFFGGLGISYRFDMHDTDEFIEDTSDSNKGKQKQKDKDTLPVDDGGGN